MENGESQKKSRSTEVSASLAAAALAAIGFCNSAHGALVIQQIYGDGGFTVGATYMNDYVDLYNSGTAAVSLSGIDLEYGSASSYVGANTFEFFPLPTTSLAAGSYFLIEMAGGTYGGALPTPDLNDSNSAIYSKPSFSSGKFALVNTALTGPASILDYVTYGSSVVAAGTWPKYANSSFTLGYGSNAGTSQAIPTTTLNDSLSLTRGSYTGDNNTDFSLVAPDPISSSVPEPATLGMLASAGALLLARRRTR